MREKLRRKADKDLLDFTYYTNYRYVANWHHRIIAEELTDFLKSPNADRRMLFVPPQHGKSELASRRLPAFALGLNPDLKIAACSYSADLAKSFNRDVQRIIQTKEYKEIFPNTRLNEKNVATDAKGAFLKNSQEFEVIDRLGSYKAVGTMGPLSGRTVDLAIIDDPIKDRVEANSPTYRQRLWEWYLNVLETRLHNNSKVLMILTRWHEDDLAGRLLEREPEKWDVIKLPALREKEVTHPKDKRKLGEALWEARHSKEKLMRMRGLDEKTFISLYQQRPAPEEGNKVKSRWFEYCHAKEVPENLKKDLWIDGAYTKKTENDPTGLMVTAFDKNTSTLYVWNAHDDYLEMPDLLDLVPEHSKLHHLNGKSLVFIEPKASGKSLKQMLKKITKLNVVEIDNHLVNEGKEARIQVASPKVRAGRVVLVKGTWNDRFVNQICTFPNATNDEYVDLLGYACHHYFDEQSKGKIRAIGKKRKSQW